MVFSVFVGVFSVRYLGLMGVCLCCVCVCMYVVLSNIFEGVFFFLYPGYGVV